MSTDSDKPETQELDSSTTGASAPETTTSDGPVETSHENVEIGSPEFQEVAERRKQPNQPADLDRFQDIKVKVSADLGRAEIPIQTLMNIGEGSVLELDRTIDSPVELVAQGVPLACGEVVVVNGCFAIRVTKVYENRRDNA